MSLPDTLRRLQDELARTPQALRSTGRAHVRLYTDPLLVRPGDAYAMRRHPDLEHTPDQPTLSLVCHPGDADAIASVFREWDWSTRIVQGPPPANIAVHAPKYHETLERDLADQLAVEAPVVPAAVALAIAGLLVAMVAGIAAYVLNWTPWT